MGAIILLVSLFFLLLLGMPIVFAVCLASMAFLLYNDTIPYTVIPQMLGNSLDSYNVIAIPFFILAAQIMNSGGVTEKMMNFASTLVGHIRGGLAHVNILTSMLFAGMSGSAVADSAGLGQILIPAMKKKGYSAGYSAAVTAASSTIGPIIPPSVPIVMYGILAEASIKKLFLAGAIPGFAMGMAMLVLSYIIAVRNKFPAEQRSAFKTLVKSSIEALPALMTPVIILGGMWGGLFSPTEAAAVAVAYAIILGVVQRELSLAMLWRCIQESAMYSAVIMIIVASAGLFGWILSTEQIPAKFSELILSITHNKYFVLLIINLFLLVLGCFMEILAVMVMTIPVLLPLLDVLGIDRVHFGIVMVLNLMIGLLSPPFGLSLYIAQDIAKIPYSTAVRATLPYIALIAIILFIVTYFPAFMMVLPNMLG
ncbi:MAG: TRAP transporter large permease [Desulfopila sp.]